MNALLYYLLCDGILGLPTRLACVMLLITAVVFTCRRKHETAAQLLELIWLICSFQACHGIINSWAIEGRFTDDLLFPVISAVFIAYITATIATLLVLLMQWILTRSLFIPRKPCIAGILCSVVSILLNSYLIICLMKYYEK